VRCLWGTAYSAPAPQCSATSARTSCHCDASDHVRACVSSHVFPRRARNARHLHAYTRVCVTVTPAALYCGHGPAVTGAVPLAADSASSAGSADAASVSAASHKIDEYIRHRLEREQQVLDALHVRSPCVGVAGEECRAVFSAARCCSRRDAV
jgi:hypothetical protein